MHRALVRVEHGHSTKCREHSAEDCGHCACSTLSVWLFTRARSFSSPHLSLAFLVAQPLRVASSWQLLCSAAPGRFVVLHMRESCPVAGMRLRMTRRPKPAGHAMPKCCAMVDLRGGNAACVIVCGRDQACTRMIGHEGMFGPSVSCC